MGAANVAQWLDLSAKSLAKFSSELKLDVIFRYTLSKLYLEYSDKVH